MSPSNIFEELTVLHKSTVLLIVTVTAWVVGGTGSDQKAQVSTLKNKVSGSASVEVPQYDVISIHPVDMAKDTSGWGLAFDAGHFRGYQVTASMLIWAATGITDLNRIKGTPAWASKTKYTIDAKVTQSDVASLSLDTETKQAMLLALLRSRFQYASHYERAESPALALVVVNGGAKHLTPHASGSKPNTSRSCWSGLSRPGFMKAEGCSMDELTAQLDVVDNRSVINQTGLTALYDFDLHFDNNATSFLVNGWTTPVVHDPAAEWPSLYEALPRQLGLKLKPVKAALPILVIDHLEPASDN